MISDFGHYKSPETANQRTKNKANTTNGFVVENENMEVKLW